jgi:hypothetical protein
MENDQAPSRREITISKKKFFVFLLIFIVLIVIGLQVSDQRKSISVQEDLSEVPAARLDPGVGVPSVNEIAPYPYPYPRDDVDYTDTREFLKTNYSAQIYTREVREVVEEVESIVHETKGRVDEISSSEKHGRVSFVIPKSNLSEFRDEIEEITNEKLYTEDISSQNLLGQKQNIEERTEVTSKTLVELEEEKEELDLGHAARIQSIQTQINALQSELNTVRSAKAEAESDEEINKLNAQEISLVQKISAVQSEQTKENQEYFSKNATLVKQIERVDSSLDSLAEEDEEFLDNIETVTGHVNVNWISWWNMGNKLSLIPMWLNTLIIIILVLWFLSWHKVIPRIKLV